MAAAEVGEADLVPVFQLLYDSVNRAMSKKTGKFKYVLVNLKCTLDPLQNRVQRLIGNEEQNGKLGLSKEEVEKLIVLMHKGVELVGKFSKLTFRMRYYCCYIHGHVGQVAELDKHLRQLLEMLWEQELEDLRKESATYLVKK